MADTSRGSVRTRTMSADSMATSVPAPMAMPTSACDEGGSVVHTVARHRYDQPSRLDLLDLRRLLVGQHFGEEVVEAQLRGHPRGDLFGVAGEHHDADAHVLEPRQRLRATRGA